jgi:predicted  nucleic acid-binding Zn-ribbon protein
MEVVDREITSFRQQITATAAKIKAVESKIDQVERAIDDVVQEIKDVEIKMGAATSSAEDKKQLEKQWDRLAEDKKQLAQEKKQLRDEKLFWLTKSERLSIAMSTQNNGEFDCSLFRHVCRCVYVWS